MNKAGKRIMLAIIIVMALGCAGSNYNNVSASENGLISYNQKYGNNTNSADHTPEASNPSDVHISHNDLDGFEYKLPGSKTTYYADKNSPLYKQLHNQHDSSSTNKEINNSNDDNSDDPSSKMPKLSSSKPKRKEAIIKTIKMNKNNKKLFLIHRDIITVGIAVVLFGIIYGIVSSIKHHEYRSRYFR